MKRVALCLALAVGSACIVGCGSSPREAGKAYAKSVIAEIDNGNPDPTAIQRAAMKAQSRIQSMSPAAGAEFMAGYQEVVLQWVETKMP